MTQNARQLPSRSTDCTTTGTCSAANQRLDLSYGFDANGNVSQITDNTSGGRQTRAMSYDGLDRLTQTTSLMFGTATYAYDALDNLTRVKLTGGSQARDHYYCYDTAGRLGNVKTGSCSGATVIGLSYDVQGNLQNKNGQMYSFDYGNRLREVTGKEKDYTYDAYGRRVLSNRQVNDSNTLRSVYTQDGQLVFQQDQGQLWRKDYIYLGGSLIAERQRPNTAAEPVTVTYQHTDALGSPIATTDAGKAFVDKFEYEPYGQLVNGTLKSGPGYTGHMQDAATGLTYMQQRYYDPQLGVFDSVDPVTAYEKPITNFCRYCYGRNNPYKFTDPDGRNWLSEAFASFFGTRSGEGNPHHQPENRNDKGLGLVMAAGPAAGIAIATGGTALPAAQTFVGSNATAVYTATEVAAGAAGVTGAAGIGGTDKAVGMTAHAVDQAITRAVKPAQILDAVKNTLKTTAVKIDRLGRPSYKAIGQKATVAINPETKKIVTVHPTSTKVAEKLMKANE